MDISVWLAFVAASASLLMFPGPAVPLFPDPERRAAVPRALFRQRAV